MSVQKKLKTFSLLYLTALVMPNFLKNVNFLGKKSSPAWPDDYEINTKKYLNMLNLKFHTALTPPPSLRDVIYEWSRKRQPLIDHMKKLP